MSDLRSGLRKLAEKALAGGGNVPLQLLVEVLLPAAVLRELARNFGVSPKGGFRLDKAPAHALAPPLVAARDPELFDALLAALAAQTRPVDDAGRVEVPATAAPDLAPLLELKEAELSRTRDELLRAREGATRALERESELRQRLDEATASASRLRAGHDRLRRAAPDDAARDDGDRGLRLRVHELELERDGWAATDAALRRQLAFNQSRMRELEETVAELEALLPKGKRRRKPIVEPPPAPADKRFRLPYFAPSFYKSLDGKDRRSVERAFHAILLFCTEGHAYPGLEVKQLGGQDMWSLRASLGLRVYFTNRDDGDVEFLELGDREEQHTTLRRLKDR